jgi:large subunit ribosomal protein L13
VPVLTRGTTASGHATCLTTVTRTKATTVRTYTPKPGDVQRQWHVIDATDVVLGRLASQVAVLLRGKHKPTFAPHVDTGDFVVIVNADKVALTGNKLEQKRAYRHSGYPGGLRSQSYVELLEKHPTKAVEKAVRGMLPKNSIARAQITKLKVYAGPEHPHQAQQPQPFEITQVSQ